MTSAPKYPHVHSYDPGKNPMEIVDTSAGRMERWRADALLVGETSAATQARHDAVAAINDLEQQKRDLAAGQAALAINRATFDAEKAAFADKAVSLAGRLSVEWDRMQKLRADQERAQEEPLAFPPGDPSKLPQPSLELEDDATPGPHAPGGELHVVAAKEDPDIEGDNIAGTPSITDGDFLRLKHSVASDQAEFPDPQLPRPPDGATATNPC
jgi:hypothetical protein